MRATLSQTATGTIKSKILDARYNTCELVLEVTLSPTEFGKLIEKYNEQEFDVTITDAETSNKT